jgi:hypothetical protein
MRLKILLSIAIFALIVACSVLKKDDPEKDVREYISAFQMSLQKNDEEILKQFQAKQSEFVILQIIRILQNKENTLITSEANFAAATMAAIEDKIKVDVPVTLKFDETRGDDGGQAMLTLWLQPKEKTFIIAKIEGETLYQEYTSLKNRNEWVIQERVELDKRAPVYAQAQALEEKYDSVIWYATYNDQNFFYVVEGEWKNYFMEYKSRKETLPVVKMGLVDSAGVVVIPIKYDLIGTLAFDNNDLVEIYKDGKTGYFDLESRKVVAEPLYDMIIPYGNDNVQAVVKQDSLYGWLDKNYVYTAGLPSQRVKAWIATFEYLRKPVSLKAGNQIICEIPNAANAGNGIVMPPSYFIAHGLFDRIEGGICTTGIPINGWTEYKETKGTVFEMFTENLNAIVTTLRERYLEGREEFYTTNKLIFVDSKQDTLNVSVVAGESISISLIDSTLLEARTPEDYWFGEYNMSGESNLTHYSYFQIRDNGSVVQLKSDRLFPQTEFVKLDSSYITGEFNVYNEETEKLEASKILSVKTLTSMRNEILGMYGYIFPDQEVLKQFSEFKWYQPVYDSISDFEADMFEVDKHNLAFLDKMILRLNSNFAAND